MVGNPYRWRAVIPQLENRNATAGCMLSLLFIVPYLARSGAVDSAYLALLVVMYVVLIVPLLTGILPKKRLITFVRCYTSRIVQSEIWIILLQQIWFLFYWIHSIYMQLDGIHTTTMQIIFNLVCERWLCPEQRFCSLYVLFFFSVLAYLQRALQTRPWTNMWNETSAKEFIKLTTAFIIARLGKGVAMSMILLTLSLQFDNMEPSLSFVGLTCLYFCISQYQDHPQIKKLLTHVLSSLSLQYLDGMEELWIPVMTSSILIITSIIITFSCLLNTDSYFLIMISIYINVIAPTIIMLREKWHPLSKERESITRFPLTSWKHPEIRSGGVCAVCLDKLGLLSGRTTRCGHVFHGSCLRICLRYSTRCPLCKSQL